MSHARPPISSLRPAKPLSGSVRLPGEEAPSHCALLLGGLSLGESRLVGLSESSGVLRTAGALRALGAEVAQDAPGAWRIAGRGVGGLREPRGVLDVGSSDSAASLLCGVLASHDLFAILTGSDSISPRPMQRLRETLGACGARFQGPATGGLPLAIQGARDALPVERCLKTGSALMGPALLLAGLNAPGWTRITETAPACGHAERMLRHFGATVLTERAGDGWVTSLMGQPELHAADMTASGDPFLAAHLLVAALIVPGSAVTVRGVGLASLRAGLLATLRDMGAQLGIVGERRQAGGDVADVTATYTGLRGVDVPAERAPGLLEDYPILAVAAACAAGPTRMPGAAGLRAKDAGALSGLIAMLRRNQVRIDEDGDDLVVHGNPVCSKGGGSKGGGRVLADSGVRLAMAELVLGLASAAPVAVDDAVLAHDVFSQLAALIRQLEGSAA